MVGTPIPELGKTAEELAIGVAEGVAVGIKNPPLPVAAAVAVGVGVAIIVAKGVGDNPKLLVWAIESGVGCCLIW
jgi:hypothetical protein